MEKTAKTVRPRSTRRIPATVRAEVLERAAGRCEVCGRPVGRPVLHHRRRVSQGGQDVAANLLALHGRCHVDGVHGHPRLAEAYGWLLRSGQPDVGWRAALLPVLAELGLRSAA